MHLRDTLTVLMSSWVIGTAAVLAIAEFLADKIPAFDSLWGAIHTFIRIPAGAMLAVACLALAFFVPLLFLLLMVGFVAFTAWALPRLWRSVSGRFRGMAYQMVSRFNSLGGKRD